MNEVRVDGVGGQIFCHRSSSDAKSMSYSIYTVSRVAMSLSNSMTESDNSITLGLNTVYCLSGPGEMHSVPVKTGRAKRGLDSRLKCVSESDGFHYAGHDTVMIGFMVLVIYS